MLQTQTQQCNRSKQVQAHTQIKQRLQTKCMCKVSRVSIAVINWNGYTVLQRPESEKLLSHIV